MLLPTPSCELNLYSLAATITDISRGLTSVSGELVDTVTEFNQFLSHVSILMRRNIDIPILSTCLFVRLSVRPSVTFRYSVKTA